MAQANGNAAALKDSTRGRHRLSSPAFEQLLTAVRDAAMIVTRDRRLLYANLSAERMLSRRHLLQLRRGKVDTATVALEKELGRSIDSACAKGAGERHVVVLRRGVSQPLVLLVECIASDGDTVMLVGADPTIEPTRAIDSLRGCFALTRSEAEVAAAIGAGHSSSELAAQRGVSVNTIRTQLKTIAAKLGCTRQSEIAAIVRAIPTSPD